MSDVIYEAILNKIKKISEVNSYNFTEDECKIITDKIYSEHDINGTLVDYASDFNEDKNNSLKEMVIVDPQRDGCVVWYGSNRQMIKGTVKECCDRLPKGNIILDTYNIGILFAEEFERRGIKFKSVTHYNIF